MDGRLRVTHCPVNTAGIPWANVQALRARGVDAQLVVFNRYRLHPEADVDLERAGNFLHQQTTQWRAFAKLAPQTDIFHFYFGLTLVPKMFQFPLLKAMRKPSVMHFLGSDIRGRPKEDLGWARRASAVVVGSYDAIRWVPDAHVVPPGLDLRPFTPVPPSESPRPLVVHAPSSRSRKGTEEVVAAADKLGLDLELVEGVDHRSAFERYRAADLVVDQLNAGWYGMFAIEATSIPGGMTCASGTQRIASYEPITTAPARFAHFRSSGGRPRMSEPRKCMTDRFPIARSSGNCALFGTSVSPK